MNKSIKAKNLSAQLQYQAAGNPPSTLPHSAISNAFPGLEMDFRNIWKRILVGIELHEASNFVVGVDPDAPPAAKVLEEGYRLMFIEDVSFMVKVVGPKYPDGNIESLPDTTFSDPLMPLEWSNALALIVHDFSGKTVNCRFESLEDATKTVEIKLEVRQFFDEAEINGETTKTAVIARDIAPPGQLTQSLCSPWQNDYRECACFYWAATRPDYVNVEARPDGTSAGNNWMQKDRTEETPRVYLVDDWMDPNLVNYTDLFRDWETELRFIIGGTDEEPVPKKKNAEK
ncbi:MAG TPA: hypothetical protein VK400_00205 [Pyrinomonadaceae bacterium]|nr:hypothetical protein [Pyrinomonadaceae bacterium]